jgi:hypothetical protein
LRKGGAPLAFKGNFELHHEDSERVILERAGDSLSPAQIQGFNVLDDGRFLEPHIFGSSAREHALYWSAARPKQFAKPSKIDGLANIVEKEQPETPAQEHEIF